jgi:purine nucleoside permease
LSGEKLGPGYSAYLPSLEAAHRVGSVVIYELVRDWSKYESTLPAAK